MQAEASKRIKQLEAENAQLKQAAAKRSQALAQSKQFIDTYVQRSSSLVKPSTDGASQGNNPPVSSGQTDS